MMAAAGETPLPIAHPPIVSAPSAKRAAMKSPHNPYLEEAREGRGVATSTEGERLEEEAIALPLSEKRALRACHKSVEDVERGASTFMNRSSIRPRRSRLGFRAFITTSGTHLKQAQRPHARITVRLPGGDTGARPGSWERTD